MIISNQNREVVDLIKIFAKFEIIENIVAKYGVEKS